MTSPGRVCSHCSHIKQRCDGGSPCSRCARLGHICEPQSAGNANSRSHRRPRASRSRGGCLSCKARKKKCDEIRPRCSDCRRLNLPCRWRPAETSSSDTTEVLVDIQPITPTASSDEQGSPVLSIDDSMMLLDDLFATDALPLSPPGLNPYLSTEEDRSLFNHYVHIVARALSRSNTHDDNPFLATLLPIAAASDTVTSVILGLSGCHWKRVYPNIWNCALARQGRALAQVNNLLGLSDRQSTLEACATVLLLCLTELVNGASSVWKWHLKAASAILKSPGMQGLVSTPEWTFCISLFHYLDSMSTISRCKPPLLHGDDSMSDLASSLTRKTVIPSDGSVDAIYGISPALFDFLGMVNLLAKHRSRRVDELSELGFRTAAAHLLRQIDEWRVEQDGLGLEGEIPHATTAFEWAIRLRLHQIVDGYDLLHPYVEQAVSTILDAVLEIPYGSKVEGCLLFPLVIAGAGSMQVERRMMVKERLMVMENTLGFGHIQSARQLLETVWESDNEMNWASVRYSQFPGVVFI